MHLDRPNAPGYLANLMARLFHDVSGDGLRPLGIRPEQFPVLVQLWFAGGASHVSLAASLELDAERTDALVQSLADDGLIVSVPADRSENLVLTEKANAAREPAMPAARHANQAAAAALSEPEMTQFLAMMNRVIDALQHARA